MKSFLRNNVTMVVVAALCLSLGVVAPAAAAKAVQYAKKAGYAKTAGTAKKADTAKSAETAKKADIATLAATAQVAGTAGIAKTAESADTASDASKLGGVAPGAYLSSPVRVSTSGVIAGSTSSGYRYASVVLACPAGKRVMSGGMNTTDGTPQVAIFRSDVSADLGTYFASLSNNGPNANRDYTVWAICA